MWNARDIEIMAWGVAGAMSICTITFLLTFGWGS